MSVDAAELSALPIFSSLPEDELNVLAVNAERIEIETAGVELTREGDFGHAAYVVLSGEARVVADGRDLRTLASGDMFGEVAVLASGRRTASVISSTPMVIASIFKRDLWKAEEKNPAFAARLRLLRQQYE